MRGRAWCLQLRVRMGIATPGGDSLQTGPSEAGRLTPIQRFSRAVKRVVADERATPWVALIVVLAGAGRGASPSLSEGWSPIFAHGLAGLAFWLLYSALVWVATHRSANGGLRFASLSRATGLAALPLLGLWLHVVLVKAAVPHLALALHVIAVIVLAETLRVALSLALWRAVALCLSTLGVVLLLIAILGIPRAAAVDGTDRGAASVAAVTHGSGE